MLCSRLIPPTPCYEPNAYAHVVDNEPELFSARDDGREGSQMQIVINAVAMLKSETIQNDAVRSRTPETTVHGISEWFFLGAPRLRVICSEIEAEMSTTSKIVVIMRREIGTKCF